MTEEEKRELAEAAVKAYESEPKLRAEIATLDKRLKEQATTFCKAHQREVDRANVANLKLQLAQVAAFEATEKLAEVLLATGYKEMPPVLRRCIVAAMERVQRIIRQAREA